MVKTGRELEDEGQGDAEAEHEWPIALGLVEGHLQEGPPHHGSHHLARSWGQGNSDPTHKQARRW
jgi:hypothetical protein